METNKAARTLVKYRFKNDEERKVYTVELARGSYFEDFLTRIVFPICDHVEFVTVDWNFVIGERVIRLKPTTLMESHQKRAIEVDSKPALMVTVNLNNDSKPVSASAPAPKGLSSERRADDKYKLALTCENSGLLIGEFTAASSLSMSTPFVKLWQKNAFLHPVYSMELRELLYRAKAAWQTEKSGLRAYPMRQKQLMFSALMHAADVIKQDFPCLPNPKVVETHFPALLELLQWKYEIASERVTFPKLHVWKGAGKEDEHNPFASVGSWLVVCAACKDEYENTAREYQKKAKQKAAELAMKSIRKQMYSDVSLKRLWGWMTAQIPQSILENNPDTELLFFCEEKQISVWNAEDINALETIFLRYCETGNSISYEVSKRIRQLADWLNTYNDTFELVVDTSAERYSEMVGVAEPQEATFANRASWLIAKARWQLANKAKTSAVVGTSKPKKGDDL